MYLVAQDVKFSSWALFRHLARTLSDKLAQKGTKNIYDGLFSPNVFKIEIPLNISSISLFCYWKNLI